MDDTRIGLVEGDATLIDRSSPDILANEMLLIDKKYQDMLLDLENTIFHKPLQVDILGVNDPITGKGVMEIGTTFLNQYIVAFSCLTKKRKM